MTESRTLCLILGAAIIVCLSIIEARSQETITYQQAVAAQERWETAVVVPSPWDSQKPEKAVPEAPRARQSPIQKVIDESDRCYVAWHSRRGTSKIVCMARR